MLRRFIHARERRHATRDLNRHIRPFDWGTEFIGDGFITQDDDEHISHAAYLTRFATRAVRDSTHYYEAGEVNDYHLDRHNRLTWTSLLDTDSPDNNIVRAQFFAPNNATQTAAVTRHDSLNDSLTNAPRAIVVLPQWNAQPDSHIALSQLLAKFGIAALRLTLPYHEQRRPPELERAEHLVSSNIGRTLQSVRQAVLDARAAVAWLHKQGYTRIGIIGTSIGSCVAFLTFVHEPLLRTGVFNHVSGYFADVVWNGISTPHVRAGFEPHITLDDLRRYWMPISPLAFVERLQTLPARPMRFIVARYDLTFPTDLSHNVIREMRRRHIPLDVAWLPCGHYTLGETPWKYLDGYKIISYFRRHL